MAATLDSSTAVGETFSTSSGANSSWTRLTTSARSSPARWSKTSLTTRSTFSAIALGSAMTGKNPGVGAGFASPPRRDYMGSVGPVNGAGIPGVTTRG
jgi:hypothetical protein